MYWNQKLTSDNDSCNRNLFVVTKHALVPDLETPKKKEDE